MLFVPNERDRAGDAASEETIELGKRIGSSLTKIPHDRQLGHVAHVSARWRAWTSTGLLIGLYESKAAAVASVLAEGSAA